MMFETVEQFLNAFVIIAAVLVAISTYLIIKLPRNYYFKFASIPLMFILLGIAIFQADSILGRPYEMNPEGEFVILKFNTNNTFKKKTIEIWISQEGKSRLISFPYTKGTEEKLREAQKEQAQKGGSEMRGKVARKAHGDSQDKDDSLDVHLIELKQLLPQKDIAN
jgi:energy-coupling factor transporter transmembrane protein EcfT